jgi:uncharacterized iron-regulated protein
MGKFIVSLMLCLVVTPALSQEIDQEIVWDQAGQRWIAPADVATQTSAGDILLFGEQHADEDNKEEPGVVLHHGNQTRLLRFFADRNLKVSVGMEFFNYPLQAKVDEFLAGTLNEADFLTAMGWSGNYFSSYRDQVLFPASSGGRTLALNMPRSVTSTVAKLGPYGLSDEQRALLPPIWEQGSATYYKRFVEIMGDHVPEEKLQNYFWAHSLWDDTMAWNAVRHRQMVSDDVLLVIVGEFHVEYGDGLASRLLKHGAQSVRTVVQTEIPKDQWSQEELDKLVIPDAEYGARADYIWLWSAK